MNKSTLIEILDSLMAVKLDDHVSRLLPSHAGWTDSVEYRLRDRYSPRVTAKPRAGRTRDDHVYNRIGHIVVNPHNISNTEALISSYVFYDTDDHDQENWINASESTVDSFVDELVRSSHQQHEYLSGDMVDPTGQALTSQNLIIIFGPRGCGKTFFLNYILSKYSSHFDNESVIWVRLNLVENFGDNSDLQHWIYAQLTKIVLRYYDPNSSLYDSNDGKSIPLDVVNHLSDYIHREATTDEVKLMLNEKLMGLKQVFHSKSSDEQISPNLIPKVLGREVTTYVQKCGYSIIIVLDGLDRLEATPASKDKFSTLISQVSNITQSGSLTGMSFIAVCRTGTLDYIQGVCSDPFKNRDTFQRPLCSPPIKKIIQRRIEYIKKEVKRIGKGRGWDLSDWYYHLDNFIKYFSISNLEDMFGDNKRAQLQVLQLVYHQFLMEKGKKAYLLTETLVKAGNRWPPRYYAYHSDEKGKFSRSLYDYSTYEHRFLASIFCYPCMEQNKSHSVSPPQLDGILLGLRVLQFVEAHARLQTKFGGQISPLSAGELVILCSLFGYSEEIVNAILEEFNEYEFIRLRGGDFPMAEDFGRYEIEPMPKLYSILSLCIYDIGYINLAAMRIPLSVHSFLGAPYISAATSESVNKRDFVDWIGAKLLNPVSAIRLVDWINTKQREMFSDCVASMEPRLQKTAKTANKSGMFDIPQNMRQSVIKQMSPLLSSVEDDLDHMEIMESLEEKIRNYEDSWG